MRRKNREEEEAALGWLLKFHDLIAAAFKDSRPGRWMSDDLRTPHSLTPGRRCALYRNLSQREV